jgi:hypothetical protein
MIHARLPIAPIGFPDPGRMRHRECSASAGDLHDLCDPAVYHNLCVASYNHVWRTGRVKHNYDYCAKDILNAQMH